MDSRIGHIEHVCGCAFHVDLMLDKAQHRVTKDEPQDDTIRDVILPPLVITLARLLASRFRRVADEGLDEAVAALAAATTLDGIKSAIGRISLGLGGRLAESAGGDVKRAVESFYQAAKLQAATELGLKPRLGRPDTLSQEWMGRAYPWWIGEYHSTVLGKQIAAIAQHAILELGLSGNELSQLVRAQLTRLYGLGPGEKSPVKVPRSFRGNPEMYWVGLANNAATTARVFARLSAMEEAGITRYVLVTVGDERVCSLCRWMEGKEFTVAQGVAQRARILQTTNSEEYKAVAGWRTLKQAQDIFDGGGSDGLVEAGMHCPPLHYLCRCDLQAVL